MSMSRFLVVAASLLATLSLPVAGCSDDTHDDGPPVYRMVVLSAELTPAPGATAVTCTDGSAPFVSVSGKLGDLESKTKAVVATTTPSWRESLFVGDQGAFSAGVQLRVKSHCPDGVAVLSELDVTPSSDAFANRPVAVAATGQVRSLQLYWQRLRRQNDGGAVGASVYLYGGGYYVYDPGYYGGGYYYDDGYYDDGYYDDGYYGDGYYEEDDGYYYDDGGDLGGYDDSSN